VIVPGQPYAFRQAGLAMGIFLLVALTMTVRQVEPTVFVAQLTGNAGRLDNQPNCNKFQIERRKFFSGDSERMLWKAGLDCYIGELLILLISTAHN